MRRGAQKSTCLSQHLIILHLVTFAPADFSFQSVLVESSADIDQQGGRTGVDSTTQDNVAHALGDMNTKPQDHAHQQAFRGGGGETGNKGRAGS